MPVRTEEGAAARTAEPGAGEGAAAPGGPPAFEAPGARAYAGVAVGLLLVVALLVYEVQRYGGVAVREQALLGPALAMFVILFGTWAVTLVLRNYAILSGRISGAYYVDYRSEREAPLEWVERSGRTFNNVMQLPPWFLLACVLIMVAGRADQAQLALAWTFVGLRLVHAVVYAGWNYLPARFGAYTAGMITLMVLWYRLAARTADLWAPG